MHNDPERRLEAAAETAVDGASLERKVEPDDPFDRIAKRRAEKLQDGEMLTLPVSSWDGALVCRFGVIAPDEAMESYAGEDGLERNVNLLSKACRGFYYRTGFGEYQRVMHEGHPVAFDALFVEKLGLPEKTDVYGLTLHLYGGNKLAIGDDALTLAAWMRDTSREIVEAVVGEFVDGRKSDAPAAPSDTAPSA